MREDEAKTKWCPFARTGIEGRSSVAVNRTLAPIEQRSGQPFDIYDETRCIGSACMAWRWETGTENKGHCGLAGRPVTG